LKEFTLLSEMYAKRVSGMLGSKNPNFKLPTASADEEPPLEALFRASESSILQFKEELDILLENVTAYGPAERFVPKTPVRRSRSNSRASSNSMLSYVSSSYNSAVSPQVLKSPISLLYVPGNPYVSSKKEGIPIHVEPSAANHHHRRAKTGLFGDSYFEARQLNLSSEFNNKTK
jgi:hypothetical protein